MSNFQDKYKQKCGGSNDTATGRMMRARQQEQRRRVTRAENFSRNRDVSPGPQTKETQAAPSLDDRFRRWKLEKELKKKIDQKNKKPIFKVGVVHHNFCSPISRDKINTNVPCHPRGGHRVKTRPSPPKRITRATQKRLAAKIAASAAATPAHPSTSGAALSTTPSQSSTSAAAPRATPFRSGTTIATGPATLCQPGTSATRLGTRKKAISSAKKVPGVSFAPPSYAFKGPVGLKRIPMFGRFAISRDSLPGSVNSNEVDARDEKPWPSAGNIAVPSESPLSNRNRSLQQDALESSSLPRTSEDPSSSKDSLVAEKSLKIKLVKRTPMFGRFTISRYSSSGSANSSEVDPRDEKPWPSTGNIPVPSESPLSKRNRSPQQDALESSSLPGTSEDLSSSKDYPVAEKSREIELDAQTDATAAQSVQSEDITGGDTLACSDSPSPAMFSPYVTTSRGKEGARRERRSKMGIGCTPPDDVPTKATVMRSLNISVEEEERTAQYFKFVLQREIDRLNEICEKWEKVKGEPGLTEDAHYLINQAIGQTTLLMRKKFERFRSLVADCETGKGEMLVQCRDLQGFWDMTYVEVKNCDSRFQKLDQLQSAGWVEEEIVAKTQRPTGIRKKIAGKKFATNAKSSARSWILAKRKAISQTEDSGADVISVRHNSEESRPATSGNTDCTPREKTRRSVGRSPRTVPRSTKRASLMITPKKTPVSLLKKVQLSETKKNVRSPLTVMKISQMCKTPEIRLDETISYINSDQTPSRGILKKSDEKSAADIAVAKSARKVDFNDDVVPSQPRTDENLENSIDLGRALARIETYDSDSSDNVFEPEDVLRTNVTLRRIAKHLDFESETISETSGTCLSMTTEALKPGTLIAELPNEENHSEDDSSTGRVLRNRTVSVTTPKKSARRSIKSSSAREKIVELDSSAKENNDPQIPVRRRSLSESSRILDSEHHSKEPNRIRRSTRKSVRFNAEDCTACVDSPKPVHPMTPHSRKSRKMSLLGDDSRPSIGPLFNGDLISFDSPAVPSRIRRTSQASRNSSQ